ncbi:hypothetical protein BAUCODRAFT_37121 [Baudoinia panamericana UAMH 10762]|uniref:Uncharacterized protein n=1 Tax=Baudoinia panamericana (strain UAMH 10762) TaxID=717646 RepID=M2MPS8_BAUPA|nr:uncharacterized protein BAUCODRAFT_37121 [Baudoinia panamericana UAMH 10762]EMC93448.1 hypothetical protein BAUCODRAFT_37121 [Baudoinia panamericana UAMH 10762]
MAKAYGSERPPRKGTTRRFVLSQQARALCLGLHGSAFIDADHIAVGVRTLTISGYWLVDVCGGCKILVRQFDEELLRCPFQLTQVLFGSTLLRG